MTVTSFGRTVEFFLTFFYSLNFDVNIDFWIYTEVVLEVRDQNECFSKIW